MHNSTVAHSRISGRIVLALVALVTLVPASTVSATDTPRHQTRTHAVRKESEAERRERERREDLERRVERLEQLYDMKQPSLAPAEPKPQSATP